MKLLFIGNSYTFFNNLPATVCALSARDGEPWTAERYLRGGAGMRTHLCDNFGIAANRGPYCQELDPVRVGVLTRLLETKWDAVVLQGQSMDTVRTPDDFFAYGKALADLVRSSGSGRVLLYQTWARQHFPEMQCVITRHYDRLAAAAGCEVVRVGEAWARVFAERPDFVLHTPDRSHPNPCGSYLAACMFYRALSGKPAAGLTHDLGHITWSDKPDAARYDLDAPTAAFLQGVADSF